ncbi:MAG TPA: capsule assembly Wzi family protein [Mucilaginibacter sp.]
MRSTLRLIVVCVVIVFVQSSVHAQSLPVGTTAIEDYYRRAQLSGAADTNVSFTIRPLFPNQVDYDPEKNLWQSTGKKSEIDILPFTVQTQFTSHHPYGWNDGAMIPAKGLEGLVSGGFFARYGILSIQFKPELVTAQNSDFDTFNKNSSANAFVRYYSIYNNIDLPARFGTGTYTKVYWGQSSIRLNYKAVSFGLSTENLWWGPGIRNSLLMSNTAPGFPHITLNTLHPVQTPIGSFEAQAIAGNLDASGYAPLQPDYYYHGADLYLRKPNYWRYMNGIILTWQPKWIPGLFLGFDHSSVYDLKDLDVVNDYIPLLPSDVSDGRSIRLTSAFMRWIWTQEHAEIYFEWGQYDNTQGTLQETLAPNNERAYIFGIRKLLPFGSSKDENILLGLEVTQLQENSFTNILTGNEWYINHYIRQGYTNQGEDLGAGIGPGGNLQTLDISWVKHLKKLGLQFERYAHNNDLYYLTYTDTHDYSRHWVDLSIAAIGEWNYKNLIFNAKVQAIKSFNYQWYIPTDPLNPAVTLYGSKSDAFNLQLQAGVTYLF